MTVATNHLVDAARYQIVGFSGDAVKIPATARTITVLTQIATSIRAVTQNLAGSVTVDTPVFAVNPFLDHYSDTGASVATTDSLALSVKPVAFVQAAASTSTTGGTLAAATYYYKIVALNALGQVLISNEVSRVTTGTTSSNTLSWGAVDGAVEYRVYRGTATNTQTGYYSVTDGSLTYLDTGATLTTGTVPAAQTHAVGVYIARIDQTDNDVYLDIVGTSSAVIVFGY